MAQAETKKLDSADRFPEIQLHLVDGSSMSLPTTAQARWTVFLIYRGYW